VRVWLTVLWEIFWVISITWLLSAVLAVPLWGLITTFLWPNMSFIGAWFVTATLGTGICIVTWVLDLAAGVRM
jgi:hypothetical protein